MKKETIGIIGLGKMGSGLALQAKEKGYGVKGYDRTVNPELEQKGIEQAASPRELLALLSVPRIVFIYIPAGKAVDDLISKLIPDLREGDILIDGGNSYWGDSARRAEELEKRGIYFVDCGTSGGVSGARHGACFMVGGKKQAIEAIGPIMRDLAVENGFIHTGEPGSGHFVKLVHNGIEFGMLQAIGEGLALLAGYREKLNFSEILGVWNHGSVIRSWLIELMKEVYDAKGGFEAIPAYIEDTGEVNWLVADALRMEIPVPVIAQSVMQLFDSREKDRVSDRAIAMMRHGFGGHPFGPDKGIRHERRFGNTAYNSNIKLYKSLE